MTKIFLFIKNNALSFCLLCTFLITVQDMNAQTVEITPSYGYQFGSKLNYGRSNYLKISDSDQFGLTLGYETFDDTMIELSYTHQSSDVRIRDVIESPNEQRLADLAGDWIMIGGTKYFPKGNIRPFFGGALGLVILSPGNENRDLTNRSFQNETNFAFSFKGGVNIMISDSVGINIQGNLYCPVNWGGFYISGGTGGIGGGASLSSTTIIGGFSGGLVFRI
jgi:outer membrane protein W